MPSIFLEIKYQKIMDNGSNQAFKYRLVYKWRRVMLDRK
jgi:hypothetical protein